MSVESVCQTLTFTALKQKTKNILLSSNLNVVNLFLLHLDCCHVNTTWYPRTWDNLGALPFYDETVSNPQLIRELEVHFRTSTDFLTNQVFIEDVSLFVFSANESIFMDATLHLKVMDRGATSWILVTPNAPVTYGSADSDINLYQLKLFEEYDDLVTLLPGREYKIEINFYANNDEDLEQMNFMLISDNEQVDDGKCESRLDCDLEGYFDEISYFAMYGFGTPAQKLNDFIGMYMNFGCLFAPRDASKPITQAPDPMPVCEDIENPSNVCTVVSLCSIVCLCDGMPPNSTENARKWRV